MFAVPDNMSKINSFVYQDIPSAKDLYIKMGFRYVTGRGHSDVESAENSAPCITHVNASIDVARDAQAMLTDDIKILQNVQPDNIK
jgi:hypothetical protein